MKVQSQQFLRDDIGAPQNIGALIADRVRHTVVSGVQDPRDFPGKRKGKQSVLQDIQIRGSLRRRDQVRQDLPGRRSLADQQVSEVTLVGYSVKMRQSGLPCPAQYTVQDLSEIFVHDPAAVHREDVIEASPGVKPQLKFPALFHVPEGKLHLVAVGRPGRAGPYAFEPCRECRGFLRCFLRFHCMHEEPQELSLLQFKLVFISQRSVAAASASSEVRTVCRAFSFRTLKHIQKHGFAPVGVLLRHPEADHLARKGILHSHFRPGGGHDSPRGVVRSRHDSFRDITLFHNILL